MRRVSIPFVPLAAGEKPGAPELGGWRPLPLCLFTRREETIAVLALSLEQAVQVVAARLWRFQLRQAIEIVAQRLAN